MIKIYNQSPEADQAMQLHLNTLHDACFDLLAALLSILIGLLSLVHSIVRIAYAFVGLIVWTIGIWLVLIQHVRMLCVSHSASSPFRVESEVQHE